MRKVIFMVALFLTVKGFCEWKDYEVMFQDKEDSFEISVTTIDEKPSMGSLIIHDMHLTLGEGKVLGLLAINLQMDPSKAFLPALGVRKGQFEFQKGMALPKVPNGSYELTIDGISYGQINIDSKQGTFHPLEEKSNNE